MNKQEAIEKIEKLEGLTIKDKDFNLDIEMIPKGDVLEIIEQIDEPQKPKVPQFVAEWYEKNKDGLEWNLYTICVDFFKRELQDDLHNWFRYSDNKPIETLVKMKLFGYEVEKKKLYLASFKDTNQYLGWNEKLGEWFMSGTPFTSGVKQTQDTWKNVEIWNNQAFEIKEVEE